MSEEKKHALLSASGAEKWFSCTPSARLETQFSDTESIHAKEGTLAHEMAEIKIKLMTKQITKRAYSKAIQHIKDDELFSPAMVEYIDNYVAIVGERTAAAMAGTKDAILYSEQKLDFSQWVPEGFGTSDVIIIADGCMEVIDLKYGVGVPISAVNNKQMKLYALGALNAFDFLYQIDIIKMTIIQPRLDSISTFEIDAQALKDWAENELKPRALLAFNGEGEFVTGSHCRFCKARATCRANAEENIALAKYEFNLPPLLTDEEIPEILAMADRLKAWATTIWDYALSQAINNGIKWGGYKVVEGRSNRKYDDEAAALSLLLEAGYAEEAIQKSTLKGITDMEKLLGKKAFEDVLGSHIIKPPGKPTLVNETDPRPEWNSTASAKMDFTEDYID